RIPEKNVPKYFTALSTPLDENFIQMERKSILLLAQKIQQKIKTSKKTTVKELLEQIEKFPELRKVFEKHFQEFFWVPYNYEGPAWTKEDICKFLLDHLNDEKPVKIQLENFYARKKHVEKRLKEYTERVKPEKEFEFLFKVSRDVVHLKGYRKDMLYKAYCYMEKLLKEISRRLYISLPETRCLTPKEAKKALLEGILDQKKLRERVKYNVTVAFKKKYAVFEGKEAEKFSAKIIEEEVKSVSELKGSCACHGEGKGIVKIINTVQEMEKMEEGDVLVSKQTHPGLVPAMKKASAIITDSGGITCHAAIVSRELKIPCVIGTKYATKVLKDGDLVEVNASKGIVKKL
ncbi:MAG: PEP-utilizing enzyme, partial [Candidatus Diapherotrites archaeon]|nr:PEP-utilizing enzyme [Candidatus Diapherotrites archaeon]